MSGTGLIAPEISISPDSLIADLLTGQQATQKLNISNSGGSDLIYELWIEKAEAGDSAAIRKPVPARSFMLGASESVGKADSSLKSDDDFYAKVSTPPAIRAAQLSKGVNALVIRDYPAWGFDFNVPFLQYFGASVTTATSYEMGTIDLSPYDLIVFESQQSYAFYSAYVSNLSRFESFLNTGGVIEFHCATLTSSRFPNLPFPGGMRTLSSPDLDPYNYISNYSHPIVAGAADPLYGNSASHEALENLPSGADIIVVNESGLPTTVEYSYGRGRLIVTAMTWEIGYAAGWSSGDPLLPNALQYSMGLASGPNWISADLYSGTIPAGGNSDVNITFDATGLYGGDYSADIICMSNDPDSSILVTPAFLHVTGAPDIACSKDTVGYGDLFIGLSKTDSIIVYNNGTDILTVSELSVDNPDYAINISSFDLAPEESRPVLDNFHSLYCHDN